MGQYKVFFIGIAIGMVLGAMILALSNIEYKHGQIDALSGKVQYEKIAMPDKWVKKAVNDGGQNWR